MAIENIIASGIGFSPGKVEYIITRGFDIGSATGRGLIQSRGSIQDRGNIQDRGTIPTRPAPI